MALLTSTIMLRLTILFALSNFYMMVLSVNRLPAHVSDTEIKEVKQKNFTYHMMHEFMHLAHHGSIRSI